MSTTQEAPRTIPFSPPDIREEDIAAVVDVLRSGWITTGPVSAQFESEISALSGTRHTVLHSSATTGLTTALRLAGIGAGDEVIVPAYTYTASASVVTHVGATLRLIDSAAACPIPSVEAIVDSVTTDTAAVIVVDLAGVPFPTADLIDALAERGIGGPKQGPLKDFGRPVVIVDAAHSLGARAYGAAAASFGDFTSFSFHAVKNLTTAEGGALTWRAGLVDDEDELEWWARRLILHGQTKDALAKMNAAQWEYDIVTPGYKANMPDVLAALGLSQIRRYQTVIERRHEILRAYRTGLESEGLAFLAHPHDAETLSSAHLAMAWLPADRAEDRNHIIAELAKRGVSTNVHYKPLPLLSAYKRLGFDISDFPHAYDLYRGEITLPLHTKLEDADVHTVVNELTAVLRG